MNTTNTNRPARWAAAVLALVACFGAGMLLTAGDVEVTSGGRLSSATVSGSDSIRTNALDCFGAQQAIFVMSASTGIDSAIVVFVSQDSTHWYKTNAQDGATLTQGYAIHDGVTGDSLRNGPHTMVVAYGFMDASSTTPQSSLPFPHRYMRLKIFGKVGTTITNLSVVPILQYGTVDRTRIYDVYRLSL